MRASRAHIVLSSVICAWVLVPSLALAFVAARSGVFGPIGATLVHSLAAAAVAFILGSTLAFFCSATDLPARRLFLALSACAIFIPPGAAAVAWARVFLGTGALRPFLAEGRGMGGWTGAFFSGCVMGLWLLPLVALPAATAFAAIPAELEELALLDSDRFRAALVTVRLALPGVVHAAMTAFAVSLARHEVAAVFGARTFSWEIFTRASALDFGAAGRGTLVMLPVACAAALAWRSFPAARAGRAKVFRLGRWKAAALVVPVLLILLSLGVPFGALLKGGLSAGRLPAGLLREAGWTILLSSATGICAGAAGGALAYAWSRGVRFIPAFACCVSACTPSAVVALGQLRLLSLPGLRSVFYGTAGAVVLGHATSFLGFSAACAAPAFLAVPKELEESASIDGASRARTFLGVTLPLSWKGLAAGAFVAYGMSVGAGSLLHPPGVRTLAMRFSSLVHTGLWNEVATVSLVQLALVAVPGALLAWGLAPKGLSR